MWRSCRVCRKGDDLFCFAPGNEEILPCGEIVFLFTRFDMNINKLILSKYEIDPIIFWPEDTNADNCDTVDGPQAHSLCVFPFLFQVYVLENDLVFSLLRSRSILPAKNISGEA